MSALNDEIMHNSNRTTNSHHDVVGHFDAETVTEFVRQCLDGYATALVCALGCVGNALCIVVLSRKRFRKRYDKEETGATLGLVWLAVSNCLFCLTLLPRALELGTTESMFPERTFQLYYQMYGTGLTTTFILTSTWIIVTMACIR